MMNFNVKTDARCGASPRARRGARLASAAPLLLLAAVLGACDGDNLFNGGADDYVPVASVSAPERVSAGETISVRVDGYAARGVAQLSVSFDGIVSRDTVIDVKPAKPSVSHLLQVTIPVALQGTTLRVRAQVIDEAGQFSSTAEALVEAFGPPFVQILASPVTVQPGQLVEVEVSATATERVDQIALKLSGGASMDTTVTVSPASQSVRQTIRFYVPTLVEDTILTVTATARDQAGNAGSASRDVPFIVTAPTVSMVVPANAQAGGMLNLEVRAQALRKVSQIRVALRGGFAPIDRTVNLTPQQANVTQYVAIELPGNITDPNVVVVAEAVDRSGLIGSTVQTFTVPLNSPMTIQLVNAPASVAAGHFLDLRVRVAGPRPYKEVDVRWRGFSAALFDSLGIRPDTTVKLVEPMSNADVDVQVESPCVATDGAFIVNVTAKDEANQLSPILTAVVTVTGDAACVPPPDTSGAAIRSISAAPLVRDGLASVGSFATRPALLASRPFRMFAAGRRRRSARA